MIDKKPLPKWAADESRTIHHRWSFKLSTAGAILGALGAGLQAAPSIAQAIDVLPMWAVWAGGAVICATVSIAMYIKQRHYS